MKIRNIAENKFVEVLTTNTKSDIKINRYITRYTR